MRPVAVCGAHRATARSARLAVRTWHPRGSAHGASRALYLQLVDLSPDAATHLGMANPNDLRDDESFRRNGYVAVMVTTHLFGTEPLHHTDHDRIENVDLTLVDDITDVVWK